MPFKSKMLVQPRKEVSFCSNREKQTNKQTNSNEPPSHENTGKIFERVPLEKKVKKRSFIVYNFQQHRVLEKAKLWRV